MTDDMELESYLERLAGVVGRANRRTGLKDYCRGLMLPLARKSVEPLAASADPRHVRSKHQALHHFIAKSDWSDTDVLREIRRIVEPRMRLAERCYWIVAATSLPKQGQHLVGVARRSCPRTGKRESCQTAISLSLADEASSLPVQWRLHLPPEWALDDARRLAAGVPDNMPLLARSDLALAQITQSLRQGVPPGIVLADREFGDCSGFRAALSALALPYAVGVAATTRVLPLAKAAPPLAPAAVRDVARGLPAAAYRNVVWREGEVTLQGRFAAVRVRAADGDDARQDPPAAEWLLIEWPGSDAEPSQYFLATLAASVSLETLVHVAKGRWRAERAIGEMKRSYGLGQYEGRNWRGVHHHATLCIGAYGFALYRRLADGHADRAVRLSATPLPGDYQPRGRPTRGVPGGLDPGALRAHTPLPRHDGVHQQR